MIKPFRSLVLVKPLVEERRSGIVLTNDEAPEWGTVIAAGPKATEVLVGDKVRLKKYAMDEIKLDGETYLIGLEEYILGVEIDEK